MGLNGFGRLGVVVGLSLLVVGCGGGVPVILGDGGIASSELKGTVLLAPVSGATVVAYRASATLQRGAVLAQGAADEAGRFELRLPPWQGHVLLVASGGTYVEEALGVPVQTGDNQLQLLIPDFRTGTKLNTLRVTPISSMALALTRYHLDAGVAVAAAHQEAFTHLNAHFGGVDWTNVAPADFTDGGVTNLSPEARAGLILAGLSALSEQQAVASSVSPGLVINSATLSTALVQDAADGTLDGRAGATPLTQASVALSGQTTRTELVKAITAFLLGPRNGSALQLQDVTGLLQLLGADGDPYLFCPGQVASTACAPATVDTQRPSIAFVMPAAGATVSGGVDVEVDATDNLRLKSLRFTAPAALASAAATFASDGRSAVLRATLDVSQLPPGLVTIQAEATDDSGNPASASRTVSVDNTKPGINVASPRAGTYYSAAPLVDATAIASATPLGGFTVSSATNGPLLDADSALSHILVPATSWAIPASVADGPLDFTFTAANTAGSSTTTVVGAFLDRTPPLLTVVAPPPADTNKAGVTFTVSFTDSGAGFGQAKALNRTLGGAPVVGACTSSGAELCTFTVALAGPETQQTNTIVVWGEDAAIPPNGGPNASARHAVTFTVVRTDQPPSVAPRPVNSYRSEVGMRAAMGVDDLGRPVVQYLYQVVDQPALLAEGGAVFKIRSKMGPSDDNIPYLRWAVQQRPPPAAAVSSAWWTLDSIDGAPPERVTSGELRRSTAAEAGYELYELPILPPQPGVLRYTVHVTDAAGNDAARSFSLTYALVGAPVIAVRDTAYQAADDPASLWHFGLAKANYPQALGQALAIEKWTIYNPNAEAVWVSAPLGGTSASWTEQWTESTRATRETAPLPDGPADGPTGGKWPERALWYSEGPTTAPTGDRMCGSVYEQLWTGAINWDATPPWGIGGATGPQSCLGIKQFPCGTTTAPVHYEGDTGSGSYVRCEDRTQHVVPGTAGAYPLQHPLPVTLDLVGGGTAATAVAGAQRAGLAAWLLPPASAGGASSLNLYVRVAVPARGPASGILAQDYPLNSSNQQAFRAGWVYKQRTPLWYVIAESYCHSWFIACLSQTDVYDYEWDAYYFDRSLSRVSVQYYLQPALSTDPDSTSSSVVHWSTPNVLTAAGNIPSL